MGHTSNDAVIIECHLNQEDFVVTEREEVVGIEPHPGAVAVPVEPPMDEDAVAWAIAKAGDLTPSHALNIVKALQANGWVILKMSAT